MKDTNGQEIQVGDIVIVTNPNHSWMSKVTGFREDLYYKIRVIYKNNTDFPANPNEIFCLFYRKPASK